MTTLFAARLRELLHYDPETGVFTWRVSRGNVRAGRTAGCPDTNGHLLIRVEGRLYLAHRLAWFYVTGEWPRQQVDHRNCVRDDNRWLNLRLATPSQNNSNRRGRSGLKGASRTVRGRWQSRIKKNGRDIYLGIFDTEKDAHAAYVAAAPRLHGEFARAQ